MPAEQKSRTEEVKPGPQDQPQKRATISELERLSSACILAFNDHDFDYDATEDRREFRERISPRFQARVENYPDQAMTFNELNQLWRGFAAAEPECRMHIINISTDVNVNGTAAIYLETYVSGHQGVVLIRFMEMKWKIIKGRWMYYSCTTMGGTSADGGLP